MIRIVLAAALAVACVLAAPAASTAATISLVSMQYSRSHPVPHFRYEGETLAGDVELLANIYTAFVHCRNECATEYGRPTAVLTMSGPGGDYHEGLALADFLRANAIATVIERGGECYSACAFAFLGGTSYSSSNRIGPYVDRVIEPGGILGFHAPYRNEESLRAALLERSPTEVLAENRSSLSLMVRELVRWNVDPEIIHYMLNQGPDQVYMILAPDDYYLVRSALPPIASTAWMPSVPEAIRNACIRLLALYERTDPFELKDRITTPFEEQIATNSVFGSLSGYRLGDRLLDLGHCSATDASIASGGNLEVALYMNPGIDGSSEPILSFFNRDDYFSTAGIGGSPLKRVFQRGGIGHWFLPVGMPVSELQPAASLLIMAEKFFTIRQPQLPASPPGEFVTDISEAGSRVSHSGNVWLFEQTGSSGLFDAALADSTTGVTLTRDETGPAAFLREGTHLDGTTFSVAGRAMEDGTSVVQRVLVLDGGAGPSEAEAALMRNVQCGLVGGDPQMGC